ncbi:peptidase [Azonexus hydrophilus]|uniref:serine-type D-Ala-D-Ala carboxypeptidase n=1 Tax=Azonexus hydrophilus TaxID=418702 RepID=A0A1R1ICD0_9RHOO|nr:D-alanyl-D-alanine carboxypeptidase family protein [Azonexus hydrophilus]OMG56438.1 peptidase [Azonexus hydrophilus]
MLFRKYLFLVFSLLLSVNVLAQSRPVPPVLAAKSWLLIEMGSGQVLSEEKADQRLEPASLTKLMTAYLTFSAIRQKTLAINQSLPVSEKAWRMGGSKMFVRVNTQVAVEDLIKGMIVQSGNDACIVLAEAIAGSEENFAQMMNREARRLGMTSTNFRNSTGMPDPEHYTTARDLAKLATALIKEFPEEYKQYYSMKEFRYAEITQPNRNRLLWSDPSVDGLKTGHTDAAGYCLISSAMRDQRRLLSVVLGTGSDAARTSESLKLLNWGFLSYDAVVLYRKDQAISSLRVWKGAQNRIKAGFPNDFILAVPKGQANKLQAQLVSQQPLMAPVQAGQTVATLKISVDGKAYGEYPVPALENVPVAGIFGRAIDSVKLWFN